MEQMGKWLLVFGLVLAGIGGIIMLLGHLGWKVPGDFFWGSKNWRVYLPLGTSILLSLILTLILWLISVWRR